MWGLQSLNLVYAALQGWGGAWWWPYCGCWWSCPSHMPRPRTNLTTRTERPAEQRRRTDRVRVCFIKENSSIFGNPQLALSSAVIGEYVFSLAQRRDVKGWSPCTYSWLNTPDTSRGLALGDQGWWPLVSVVPTTVKRDTCMCSFTDQVKIPKWRKDIL